jgi:hypothetical protein
MSKDKIRFLATGDFHSDLNLIKAIKKYNNMNELDFILFTGDLSEKDNDFKKLLGVFKGKEIFMVPGNHENQKHLNNLKKHYNVHLIGNAPVKVHDDLVLFGSNYIGIGPYGVFEEEIFENLVDNFNSVKDHKLKVMLNHIPPLGTKIGDASPYVPGSEGVRVFLENFTPDLALCGHIHESSGLEEIVNKTKVINVGRTFKVFEFDTKKGKLKVLD